jgi:uncharacterized protein YgfB (UPF0149 family)
MPNAKGFATLREQYLQQSFPETYEQLKASGQLAEHLEQVGSEAEEMWHDLEAQMSLSPDLPENYLERVAELETIPEKVREMVTRELIYVPPPRS